MTTLPEINFEALNQALLGLFDQVVPVWLPGGQYKGAEYVCSSLSGGAGSSCSINRQTGKWADFATEDRGKDLISLYQHIHSISPLEAVRQLANEYGLQDVAGLVHGADKQTAKAAVVSRPAPVAPAPAPAAGGKGQWRTVVPVPAYAAKPTYAHHARTAESIQHIATYQRDGLLYGYVVRFATSSGGKEPLPYVWSVDQHGGGKWTWRTWDAPRPLYLPGGTSPGTRTVVLVEGERKAQALHDMLEQHMPGVYCIASWAGGCKAWAKADWSWLAGTTVLLWPDCDAKREPLSRSVAAQCADEAARAELLAKQPLLPEHDQPGMQAMLRIGACLQTEHGCTVSLLTIPAPGVVLDGWDAYDAIHVDGWGLERVLGFFGGTQPLPAIEAVGSQAKSAKTSKRDGLADAGQPIAPSGDEFADYLTAVAALQDCDVWQLAPTRQLVIKALRTAPGIAPCLAFNDLKHQPYTRTPWPWRERTGQVVDQDDLRLGDWLSTHYKIRGPSRATLQEAIEVVADERHYHPVAEWLKGLVWDGKPRLTKWLIHVMGKTPSDYSPREAHYLGLVGRYVLMGQVARVMSPGCKFDYSVVLEGWGGVSKSSLVKTLVGAEYFSDTHFDIGAGKDGYEQLAGIWAYELSELSALRRADAEIIKAFFSSTNDRYRVSYGRYVMDHPRQCVIWCTTNQRQYLYDLTGNRRFWPVRVHRAVLNLDWLESARAQLFAEAYAAYQAGEQYYPTRDEEQKYFVPEQEKRLVETGVQSHLFELLTRPSLRANEGVLSRDLCSNTSFVTIAQLVHALGTDTSKATPNLEKQIREWLDRYGWEPHRMTTGLRLRGYTRPAVWPPQDDGGVNDDGGADDDDVLAPPNQLVTVAPPSPAPAARHPMFSPLDDDEV